MARIRSIARLTNESRETEATETTPILEIMRDYGIVAQLEEIILEKSTVDAEANSDDAEDDDGILSPSKPSHIEFGRSTVKSDDLALIKKLGYFGKKDDELIRFAGDEIVPESKEDEVIVFKSFFRAGVWYPLYEMISEVLKKFEIYLHQLTPNAIVRLNVYIWALRSQGVSANAEGFCRVHELHYQTKVRADGLHKIFRCYNLHIERIPKL
jgi:hypothetical protein